MSTPQWLEDAVFYQIYPQSFYDSNNDGIGDLNGISEKLSYIKDLGCTAIWLTPFYESPFRDAGYDVTNFYKVAERYGTNDDFVNLCKEAHALGLKVCIDIVAGHTALECPWFQQSCLPEINEYSNRYVWTDAWDKNYRNQCIGGYSQRNGMFMKNFFYCQPSLNYGFANIDDPSWQLSPDHPDCRATKQELINIFEYWISLGADGFRVDMAQSLIKNDPDKRGIVAFWQEIRQLFDQKYPNCVLISEWSYPRYAIQSGFHIDFLIHFNLPAYTRLFRAEKGRNVSTEFEGHSFFAQEANGSIEDFLSCYLQEYSLTKGQGFISIPSGNHDLPRISYRRSKKELEVVFAFLMTMAGVPFLYYGDEIGMPYSADIPSKEGGFNRTGSRTPMQWCRGKNAGFSDAPSELLYLPVDENGVNADDQLADSTSLLNCIKKLISLRKSSDALSASGEVEFINRKNNGYPLIFIRKSNNDKFIICINPTAVSQSFHHSFNGGRIIMQNDAVTLSDNAIVLPPVSFAIIQF